MTKIELNGFRRALNNKLLEIGNGGTNREALAIETSPDELDRIQNANDRDYAMGNLERTSSRLGEVRSALGRIGAGTFGFCAGCEESISLKRLAAVPWAVYCINCQEAADRQQDPAHDEVDSSLMAA
jgi:DnaK suppressor protein